MPTSRNDFTSGNVGKEAIEAAAQVLRERVEAKITEARIQNHSMVSVPLQATDLPAAIDIVVTEYRKAGWTVIRTGDYREKYLSLN
jgi:hypothetical protein